MRSIHYGLNVILLLFNAALIFLGLVATTHFISLPFTMMSYAYAPPLHLQFSIALNSLNGFFLLLLGCVGFQAAIYGFGYGKEYAERNWGVLLDMGIVIFVLAMAVVFLAADLYTFLYAWEAMSVISFLLVIYDYRAPQTVSAGILYIVMTQVAAVFLLAAGFLLYKYTGSYDFLAITEGRHLLPTFVRNMVFLGALIGFATKAGMMPFHIWLPKAHPVAPSHVSALLSGAMLKTALYGLLLISLRLLGSPPLWWGLLLLALGLVSAVLGAFQALRETDLKRILSYSSIENMGILLLTVGGALFAMANHHPAVAGFMLMATLFHALSHALLKSVLFQGAGAVIYTTHLRSLDQLGGLMRRYPQMSLWILVGLLALAGVPLTSGFISEWLLFSGFSALAVQNLHHLAGVVPAMAIAGLLVTGALVAFLVVRVFGIAFLAEARSVTNDWRKLPASMPLALGIGGVLLIVVGIVPKLLFSLLRQVVVQMGVTTGPVPVDMAIFHPYGLIFVVLVTVLASVCCLLLLNFRYGKKRPVLQPTWTCGGKRLPTMSYTATGFSQPVARTFKFVAIPITTKYVYQPFWRGIQLVSRRLRAIQNGSVRTYLAYLFITLFLLLLAIH